MNNADRGALWDAINRYVEACRGDPSRYVYGNTARQAAVAEVEQVIRRSEEELRDQLAAEHERYRAIEKNLATAMRLLKNWSDRHWRTGGQDWTATNDFLTWMKR